jgi:hypothetical protein
MRGSKVGKCFICGRSIKKVDIGNSAIHLQKQSGHGCNETVLACVKHEGVVEKESQK